MLTKKKKTVSQSNLYGSPVTPAYQHLEKLAAMQANQALLQTLLYKGMQFEEKSKEMAWK